MDVKAINSVSQLGFEGKKNKKSDKPNNNMSYPQMDAPASKHASNGMKYLLYAAMSLPAVGAMTSCDKDTFGIGAESISISDSKATANAWYTPVCPEIIRDTVHVHHNDTVEVPGPTQTVHDTIKVPEYHTDTVYVPQIDTVYVPQIKTDTVYVPKYDTIYVEKPETVYVDRVDTVYVPEYHTDTVYVPRVDTVYVPEYHTDTVYVDKYIVEKDTVIQTVVQPINVKDAPWNVIDLLINQGLNVGIPLEGPRPKSVGANHVLFIGSRAYNEYDYKLYETQLDNIGTDGDGNGNGTLCLVSKITNTETGEVSYMKTNVVPAPGGIKLERFVMSSGQAARAEKSKSTGLPASSDYQWTYAGYELRQMAGNGKNIVTTYDKYGKPLNGAYGEIIKGDQAGEFLYGKYIYDENGNPYVGDDGAPEKAYYDFSRGKMWSAEVKKVEGTTDEFTWK